MSHSFKNYFWTAQLIAGLATAARMAVEGWNAAFYGTFFVNLYYAVLWSVGGFLCVMPIAALFAWIKVALDRRAMKRQLSSPDRPQSN